MPVEIVNGIQDLNPAWPTATDPVSEGDDHSRAIKSAIQQSFPNMTGAWVTTSQIKANGFDATDTAIVNVGTPVNATDAARKGEIDALQAQVDGNDADIAELQANDVVQDATLADHETRIGNLEAQSALYTSFGYIDTDGGIMGGSGDFTVSRTAQGEYNITFNEAAGAQFNQTLQANTVGVPPWSLSRTIDVAALSSTVWGVYCYEAEGPNAGDPIDSVFTFSRQAN